MANKYTQGTLDRSIKSTVLKHVFLQSITFHSNNTSEFWTKENTNFIHIKFENSFRMKRLLSSLFSLMNELTVSRNCYRFLIKITIYCCILYIRQNDLTNIYHEFYMCFACIFHLEINILALYILAFITCLLYRIYVGIIFRYFALTQFNFCWYCNSSSLLFHIILWWN